MPKKHAQLIRMPKRCNVAKAVKQAKKRSGPGRPSPYEGREMEIATAIAVRLALGEPLISVCGKDGFPDANTIHNWVRDRVDIAGVIARARVDGFDAIAAECLTIANTPQEGVIITEDKDGRSVKSEDMLGHRRLQIETRLKLLSKWDPKRYGEAAQPTTVNVGVQVNQVSMEELAALAADKREAIEYLRGRA